MEKRRVVDGRVFIWTRRGWRQVLNGCIKTRRGWRVMRRRPGKGNQAKADEQDAAPKGAGLFRGFQAPHPNPLVQWRIIHSRTLGGKRPMGQKTHRR